MYDVSKTTVHAWKKIGLKFQKPIGSSKVTIRAEDLNEFFKTIKR